jgi:hypothetical protein
MGYKGNLGYLLWLGANEETWLVEFLNEHLEEFPDIPEVAAKARLQGALLSLLDLAYVAVYKERWARPESRVDLELPEAKRAVSAEENWSNAERTEWFHYVHRVCRDYWPDSPF